MIIDIIFLLFIGVGFYWGYKKGIIYALFSLAAYFLGIILALKFSYMAAKFVKETLNPDPKMTAVISFIIVFILVVLLVRLIAWMLEQVLKAFTLNLVNQLLGGCIHALIGLYVICVLLWFMDKWGALPSSQKKSSHLYHYVATFAPDVVEYSGKAVPMFRHAFEDFDKLLDEQGKAK